MLFGSILLKHGRHFDNWNQPLNMRMRVCYLVIHIENLLHSLQLFYFHLLTSFVLYILSSTSDSIQHRVSIRTACVPAFISDQPDRHLKYLFLVSLKIVLSYNLKSCS
jgi:hypothetical protein